jgi:hypothetical protein
MKKKIASGILKILANFSKAGIRGANLIVAREMAIEQMIEAYRLPDGLIDMQRFAGDYQAYQLANPRRQTARDKAVALSPLKIE